MASIKDILEELGITHRKCYPQRRKCWTQKSNLRNISLKQKVERKG